MRRFSFVVERGVFFHKDYQLYYEYMTDARGEELTYALRRFPAGAETWVRAEVENVETLRATERKEGVAGTAAGAAAAVGARRARQRPRSSRKGGAPPHGGPDGALRSGGAGR